MRLQDGQAARAVMNYYHVLDLPPDATPEDIKRAYRQLVRKHHPDVAGEGTRDRFHQIQAAYEILSDPGERRKYDLSVGWGRSPRTAIPYRPARSQSGGGASSRSTSGKSVSPKPPPSPRPTERGTGTSSRSGGTGNRPPQKGDSQTGNRPPVSNRHNTSSPSGRSPSDSRRQYVDDRTAKEGEGGGKRSSSDRKDAVNGRGYTDRRGSTTGPPPNNTSSYKPINGAAQHGNRPPATNSPSGSSSGSGSRNTQSRSQSTSGGSASYKPYTPPPRPEPSIPSFNKGVRSLKEALRCNRYSVATEIADLLAAHYPNRPLAMRLFVKAYHLRGNEMLYYKRYELAEIYLYEALKTAHSHYPELVATIQSDLERSDTNRRELGMI